MREYFTEKRADEIAAMAGKSLLYEVSTTPKPGLVDRANSGAHRDMDLFHFIDSSAALIPHFRQLFLMGVHHAQDSPQRLFGCIRYPGMLAEDAMFAATKGVNTHKGLIFSLGILCAALGYSFANTLPCDTGALLSLCGRMASLSVEQDLDRVTVQNARTFGERLYLQTGSAGIRGEAAAGFPSVRHYGLPALRRFMAEGKSLNDAGVLTLLILLGHVEDTNVISRRGLRAAQSVRRRRRKEWLGSRSRSLMKSGYSTNGSSGKISVRAAAPICWPLHLCCTFWSRKLRTLRTERSSSRGRVGGTRCCPRRNFLDIAFRRAAAAAMKRTTLCKIKIRVWAEQNARPRLVRAGAAVYG